MIDNKEMICIVCPIGCHLTVSANGSDYAVEGNKCPRGKAYAIDELSNPLRTVTSTVKIFGGSAARLPVKTEKAFPKGRMFELMSVLKNIEVQLPVKTGQVILGNVLETGINIVSSKTVIADSYSRGIT